MLQFTFIVFVDGLCKELELDLIKTLQEKHFSPLVDGKNKTKRSWFYTNCKDTHLLFLPTGDSYIYNENEATFAPILGVFYNNGALQENTMQQLDLWVKQELFGYDTSYDFSEFEKSLTRPEVVDNVYSSEQVDTPMELTNETPYDFSYHYLDNEDCMLYQVIKPFTDRPYVTLTREFTKKGHIPFFSSLFKCHSWGVSDKDILFLKSVWDFLKMAGEFDIDKLVRERIEQCLPGEAGRLPESEPEVWRNTMDNVKQILNDRKQGFIAFD